MYLFSKNIFGIKKYRSLLKSGQSIIWVQEDCDVKKICKISVSKTTYPGWWVIQFWWCHIQILNKQKRNIYDICHIVNIFSFFVYKNRKCLQMRTLAPFPMILPLRKTNSISPVRYFLTKWWITCKNCLFHVKL